MFYDKSAQNGQEGLHIEDGDPWKPVVITHWRAIILIYANGLKQKPYAHLQIEMWGESEEETHSAF